MTWFSRCRIVACDPVQDGMRSSTVAPLRIRCLGWGVLSVRTHGPGRTWRQFLAPGAHEATFVVPRDSTVTVRHFNLWSADHRTLALEDALAQVRCETLEGPVLLHWGRAARPKRPRHVLPDLTHFLGRLKACAVKVRLDAFSVRTKLPQVRIALPDLPKPALPRAVLSGALLRPEFERRQIDVRTVHRR